MQFTGLDTFSRAGGVEYDSISYRLKDKNIQPYGGIMYRFKLIALTCLASNAIYPMSIIIGDGNVKTTITAGGVSTILRNTNASGNMMFFNGKFICNGCSGHAEIQEGLIKRIIDCKDGNCVETQVSPLGAKQIKSPAIPSHGFWDYIKQHPSIAAIGLGVLAGSSYAVYKYYKTPKKR